jgi:hypothetical protein
MNVQNRENRADKSDTIISIEIYSDQSGPYAKELQIIRYHCKELSSKHKVMFHDIKSQDLSSSQVSVIEDEIRNLLPQKRGTVVATRRYRLPLSNSKNLNLSNTPVLLVRLNGGLEYVFPCLFGETYYDIPKGLLHLKTNLPSLAPLKGVMEVEITDYLIRNIDKFEKGLSFVGHEVETSAGFADLIYSDKEKKCLIIEVEREGTDTAVGQILRLCAAYERKNHLEKERVRAVIACTRIHAFVFEAAKRAGIEIWTVPNNFTI